MKDEIGKRLKTLRLEKGFTQKELACRVSGGLDYTYIGKIERGEQFPSLKILVRIGEALGVPVGYFFRDGENLSADLLLPELRPLLAGESGRELVRALRLLHPAELPLLTEIIKLLVRHRTDKEDNNYLRAAEGKEEYRKR